MGTVPPASLGPLLGALSVAILVALVIRRFKMPYTIALVLAGLLLGAMSRFDNLFSIELTGILSAQTILFLILPPLLFDGASKLSFDSFKRNWRVTTLLAIPSVVLSMFIIAMIVWYGVWGGDPDMFLFALLLGAVLAPTDPVSVLALFKECGAPHQLATIVESESLFNDGTGVVLFQVVLALLLTSLTGDSNPLGETVLHGGLMFAQMVIIGAVVGAALGYASNMALAWTRNHLLEVTVTVALAFGSFLVAEQFHGSGVIAVVVAGMVVGNVGKMQAMTPQARVALDHFWEMVAFLVNAVLFLLIGFEIMARISLTSTFFIAAIVAIVAALVARLLIYPTCAMVTKWSPDSDIPMNWRHIIFWGGLRGSVPLALMLILLDVLITNPGDTFNIAPGDLAIIYDELLIMSFSVVLFTLIIQGMTMTPLMKKLGVGGESDGKGEDFEKAIAIILSSRAALQELEKMGSNGLASANQIEEAIANEQARINSAKETLSELSKDEEFRVRLKDRIEARLLAIRLKAVSDAEMQGLISEHTSNNIRWDLDTDLAMLLEHGESQGDIPLPQAIKG